MASLSQAVAAASDEKVMPVWIIDGLSNFSPYYGLPLGLLIVPVVLFRRWKLVALAAVPFMVWGVVMISVNWFLVPARSCSEPSALRVVTANVMVGNTQRGALADAILDQSPDVVVFEELVVDLEELSPALAKAYPYRISTETPWVTLASRLPLEDMRRVPLDPAIPGREPLAAQVRIGDQLVTLLGTHEIPALSRITYREHLKQYELLEREVREASGPVMVIGDINATVYSPAFVRLLMRTDLRSVSDGSQHPTHTPTLNLSIRIDHVLIRDLTACEEQVFELPGSDHDGLVVGVRLK